MLYESKEHADDTVVGFEIKVCFENLYLLNGEYIYILHAITVDEIYLFDCWENFLGKETNQNGRCIFRYTSYKMYTRRRYSFLE